MLYLNLLQLGGLYAAKLAIKFQFYKYTDVFL